MNKEPEKQAPTPFTAGGSCHVISHKLLQRTKGRLDALKARAAAKQKD